MTPIGDEERRRFETDGFLVFERLIDDGAVRELGAAYDQILERDVAAIGDRLLGGITRQVMMPCLSHPAFDRNPALDAAAEIAERLVGAAPVRTFDMLIYKPPGHPHETPWHQDMSYLEMPVAPAGTAIPLDTLQFWVALDDADVENGCMHFLPGYHTQPLLPHRIAAGDPSDDARLLEIVDAPRHLDLSKVVAAPLRAGGATVHSYGTPHYTPPNHSADRPRRAFIFNLAPEPVFEKTLEGMASRMPRAAVEITRRASTSFRRPRRTP
jgi:Phytanoyl-CoA dioxygenase (PhyH)